MAVADDLLPVYDTVRTLIQSLGYRPYRVWVAAGQWSEEIHLGSLNTSLTEILPRPKVIPVGPSRLRVFKITPEYLTGGYAPGDLLPAIQEGRDHYFLVRGADGVDVPYACVEVMAHRVSEYQLILERLPRALPDF